MEGFIALAVFAQQVSDSQKKTPSTQHKQDRPSSNRGEVAGLAIEKSVIETSCRRAQVEGKLAETESRVSCSPGRED
jgi:hypothetical protein